MKLRIIFTAIVINAIANLAIGQVHIQSGTLNIPVSIRSYSDNLSSLSLQTELLYSSDQGLKVDEIASAVGTGWELTGIPVVTRKINGLSDDQIERPGTAFDITKYPSGYLYNNKAINLGCPTALNKYPIFENSEVFYSNSNTTTADRQLDDFYYTLNGGAGGAFVINKDIQAVQIDNKRNKIEIITQDQSAWHIRTSIKEFRITDENGIKYLFTEQEISRVYRISPYFSDAGWYPAEIFSYSRTLPLDENPYVVTAWLVSKIIDTKTGRHIDFTYNTVPYVAEHKSNLQAEITTGPTECIGALFCANRALTTITSPISAPYDIQISNVKGVTKKEENYKKEISLIQYPDDTKLEFNYLDTRKDIAGVKMLNNIRLLDNNGNQVSKLELTHNYFVKNEIKDPATVEEKKWSRLCLTQIKTIADNEIATINPTKFEYYLGSNATEDFVPPYFFHAKDPWGYYNGDYSGVTTTAFLADNDISSWGKVSLYNQQHEYAGNLDIYYNIKTGYAKNGLLKKQINPYGGITEYEYEQNYYIVPNIANELNSFDHNAVGDATVGGVHIRKIIEKNSTSSDKIIEYTYTDNQGHSTRWGEEPLKFIQTQESFWRAEGKRFNGLECYYKYMKPGMVFLSTSGDVNFLKFVRAIKGGYFFIKKLTAYLFTKPGQERNEYVTGQLLNLVLNYAAGVAESCLTDPPSKIATNKYIYNDAINSNLLPAQFKKVTETIYSSSGLQSGKTVYEFTSPDDFPLLLPGTAAGFENKPRGYAWMYGLGKSVKIYDNNGTLIKSVENQYSSAKNQLSSDSKTLSCDCNSQYQRSQRADEWNTTANFDEFTTASDGSRLKVDFYNLASGHPELIKKTEKIFNQSGQVSASVTDYAYNVVNNQLSSQSSVNSKGATIETKTYYVEDYNLAASDNSVLSQMKADNILNIPVSSETWITKPGGDPQLLSLSATEFGTIYSGAYRPFKTYALQTDKPLSIPEIGVFDPSKLVRNNTYIKPVQEIKYHYFFGEPVEVKDLVGNRVVSTIFGTTNRLPIASINNAKSDEVAYTSFELDGGIYFGGFASSGGTIQKDASSPTGDYCYSIAGGGMSATMPAGKEYTLTIWATSSSFSVNGIAPPAPIASVNNWSLYEFNLIIPATGLVQVSGACKVDEVRLYPKNASMTTMAYRAGVGKITDCDINNRITYYEYDGFHRISKVLDENRNIIKTYEYHFKN
jgi:hypothetical protein